MKLNIPLEAIITLPIVKIVKYLCCTKDVIPLGQHSEKELNNNIRTLGIMNIMQFLVFPNAISLDTTKEVQIQVSFIPNTQMDILVCERCTNELSILFYIINGCYFTYQVIL